jgi:hypothetical protein
MVGGVLVNARTVETSGTCMIGFDTTSTGEGALGCMIWSTWGVVARGGCMATAGISDIGGLGRRQGVLCPGLATVVGSGTGVSLSDVVQYCKSAGVATMR